MSKFLPTSGFKWIDPKQFNLNKCFIQNNSTGCVLDIDLEYQKDLRELHNDYPLALDKIEIKREILSEYQLKIAALYNFLLVMLKKFVSNFLIKKSMCFIMKTCNFS